MRVTAILVSVSQSSLFNKAHCFVPTAPCVNTLNTCLFPWLFCWLNIPHLSFTGQTSSWDSIGCSCWDWSNTNLYFYMNAHATPPNPNKIGPYIFVVQPNGRTGRRDEYEWNITQHVTSDVRAALILEQLITETASNSSKMTFVPQNNRFISVKRHL